MADEFPRGQTQVVSATNGAQASITLPAGVGIIHVVTDILARLITLPWSFFSETRNGTAAGTTLAAEAGVIHVLTGVAAKFINNGIGGAASEAINVNGGAIGSVIVPNTNFVVDTFDAASILVYGAAGAVLSVAFAAGVANGWQDLQIQGYDTETMTPQIQVSQDGGTTFKSFGAFPMPGEGDYTYSGKMSGEIGLSTIIRFNAPTAPNQGAGLQLQVLEVHSYDI